MSSEIDEVLTLFFKNFKYRVNGHPHSAKNAEVVKRKEKKEKQRWLALTLIDDASGHGTLLEVDVTDLYPLLSAEEFYEDAKADVEKGAKVVQNLFERIARAVEKGTEAFSEELSKEDKSSKEK